MLLHCVKSITVGHERLQRYKHKATVKKKPKQHNQTKNTGTANTHLTLPPKSPQLCKHSVVYKDSGKMEKK